MHSAFKIFSLPLIRILEDYLVEPGFSSMSHFRRSGAVSCKTNVSVIGHPHALPGLPGLVFQRSRFRTQMKEDG